MRLFLILFCAILTACSSKTEAEKQTFQNDSVPSTSLQAPNLDSLKSDSLEIIIKPLSSSILNGTTWTVYVAPDCIDSLIFTSEQEGREFRCEMQIDNRFTYNVLNDTLFMSEYGLISEVDASKGEEIKYRWRYVLDNRGLLMLNTYLNQELIFKLEE